MTKTERLRRVHPFAIWAAVLVLIAFAPAALRQEATQKGHRDLERLIGALTQTHVSTIVTDERMKVLYYNDLAEGLFGKRIRDADSVDDLVPEMHREEHAHGVESWKEKGGVRAEPIECEILGANGTGVPVAVHLWSTECNGEVIFVAEIVRTEGGNSDG